MAISAVSRLPLEQRERYYMEAGVWEDEGGVNLIPEILSSNHYFTLFYYMIVENHVNHSFDGL